MRKSKLIALLALPLVLAALPAEAYIGPGASAGTVAVVIGILASIVMAFFAILWYPAKRVLKRMKAARQPEGDHSPKDGEQLEKP